MGVSDGQPVSAGVTNPAFINKNIDDTTPSKLGLANTDPVSGTSATNTQREFNALWSFIGGLINQIKTYVPTWSSNNFGTSSDNITTKVTAIDAGFSASGTQFYQAGSVALSNANASKAVTFPVPFPDATYTVIAGLENTTDSPTVFLDLIITAKSASGFTATFNGPVDSANYKLNYVARKVT